MALTESWLKSHHQKPHDKVTEVADRDGMSVRVSPKGKIVFQLRFRWRGKAQRLDLGVYPDMSLKQARLHTWEMREQIAQGIDPKQGLQAASDDDLPAVFERWYQAYCVVNKKNHADIKRSFEIHVFPHFQRQCFGDISLQQWMLLLDDLALHKESIAARILSNAQQLYKWAMKREYAKHNVLLGISAKHDLQVKKRSGDRVLSETEIQWLWHALSHSRMMLKNQLFVKLCLLYGCRNGELRLAKKSDFDFHTKVRTVPQENHKTGAISGKALLRPITSHTEALLHLAMDLNDSEFLFCNAGGVEAMSRSVPLSLPTNIMQWLKSQHQIDMPYWSMHDLRRTARTNFSRLTTFEVAEIMLGHALPKIQATYDHYDYLSEQTVAYEKWHECVLGWVSHHDLEKLASIF